MLESAFCLLLVSLNGIIKSFVRYDVSEEALREFFP